ncbi:MAG: hypothetical protein ACRD6X_21240 [Pyrinomonadaceae bacterium]
MKEKQKVKVIKRKDLGSAPVVTVNEDRSKRIAAREMVSNVTNWVSDLNVRKRNEAKLAFDKLFSNSPTPLES